MSNLEQQAKRSIYMARHGERIDYLDPYWLEKPGATGDELDSPLSGNGLRQARDLAERLADEPIDHIFASPFLRTIQTALPIAEKLDLPIKLERGIGEGLRSKNYLRDPRVWSTEDRNIMFPQVDLEHNSVIDPPWPEEAPQTCERAAATISKLLEMYDGNFLLIGHGITVMSMCWDLLPQKPELFGGFCALHRIDQHDEGWHIAVQGERGFLSYFEPAVRPF